MDAPQVAALLASAAPEERARAYSALEATDDVALAVASVAPLTAVTARPVEEIDACELQRACLNDRALVEPGLRGGRGRVVEGG